MRKSCTSRSDISDFQRLSAFGLCLASCLLAIFGFAAAPAPGPYLRPGITERESVAPDGTQAHGAGFRPAVSADGRYVAFLSDADNLTPLGGNGHQQVYLRDRLTGNVELISVATDGSLGDGDAISGVWPPWPTPPVITPDGRFVAFHSNATNLVPGDTNGIWDVFVRDRQSGTTERVSLRDDGGQNTGTYSGGPSISADGRFVAFYCRNALTPNDFSLFTQVYLRDRQNQTTELISVNTSGVAGLLESFDPSITPDGRYVSFHSLSTDLVAGDTNNAEDVFVRDRQSGTTELVSKASNGALGNGPSFFSSISADGRYVAFASGATNLVPADNKPSGKTADVYVHDRQTGRTERVSVSSAGVEGDQNSESGTGYDGTVWISDDGRYVAFYSFSTNHVPNDTNGFADVFVHDALLGITEMVDIATDGTQGDFGATTVQLAGNGRYAAFQSESSNFIPGDPGGGAFLRDRGPDIGVLSLAAGVQSNFQIPATGSADFAGVVIASAQHTPSSMTAPGLQLTAASLVDRPELGDLMVSLQFPPVPSPGVNPGAPTNVYGMDFTIGGVPYEVRAVGTAPMFALYQCSGPVCTQVGTLTGGFETMADEVRVSVPFQALGASEGASVTGLRAFAAVGNIVSGPAEIVDQVNLADTTIPMRTVNLGIAPVGTDVTQVNFSTPATLTNGSFSGSVDVSSLATGTYNLWAQACLGTQCGAASVPVQVQGPLQLTQVVSRKAHGSAGTFDVDLTNGHGIECRSGGLNGDHTLVFRFTNPLASVAGAGMTSGAGSIASSNIDSNNAHNYIVNLTGVANAQIISLSLSNVTDLFGNVNNMVSPPIAVLLGDVNASRRVDAADVSFVRQQTLQAIDSSNFRADINASGRIDAADVSIARQQTLTSLP